MAFGMSATGRLTGGLALALVISAAAPLRAAPPQGPPPPQSAAGLAPYDGAEDIIVTARQAGPPLWLLKKDTAEVVLVGVLQRDLKTQTWNLSRIGRLMDGASVLYVYRSGGVRLSSSNPLDIFRAPGWIARAHLPRGTRVKDVVGAELWARSQLVASSVGMDGKLDDTVKPIFFGLTFANTAYLHAGLQGDLSTNAILKLAQKRRIKVTSLDVYPLVKTVDDILNVPSVDGVTCFQDAVEEAAFGTEHGAAASEAWSRGDLKAVRANTMGPRRNCLAGIPSLSKLVSSRTDEIVRLLEGALEHPGKTVFVIPLEPLLQHEGVLEKIHAEGVSVTSPSF